MSDFDLSQPWQSARFAAFDLETTGTNPETDRIIEVGIAVFEQGEVVDRYQQLVNPGIPIPQESVSVTGITDADVADSPAFATIADELAQRLGDDILLAYNHRFDTAFLAEEMKRAGTDYTAPPCLDPMPFCWVHLREKKITRNAQLGTICKYFDIPLEAAHRADHDAEAAGRVMLRLPDVAVLPPTLNELLQLQRGLAQQTEQAFARFRRGKSDRPVLSSGEVTIELGAAYLYGEETDPIRFLYKRLPDVRDM